MKYTKSAIRSVGFLLIGLNIFVSIQICETQEHEVLMMKEMRKALHRYTNYMEELTDDKLRSIYEFKVVVKRKQTQCFMQEVERSTEILFEYECVSPPTFLSDATIAAFVALAENSTVIQKNRHSRGGHFEVIANETGTLVFCLDNTLSRSNHLVQIFMQIYRLDKVVEFHKENKLGNGTMFHILDDLFVISRRIDYMRSAMLSSRSTLKYDYSTTTSNLNMINNFSAVSVGLILMLCALQLRTLKNMFKDKQTGV
ncbi:transmembrane emp24 domain-containing protein 5-like [Styela clava]|uniref:uncharacterized protein LOC120333365 n=1 Tax=Styela clava TaxID=7725 RepID=UPI00193A9671|nr:uncharacterized protein LOC120333365 [Styela clava]